MLKFCLCLIKQGKDARSTPKLQIDFDGGADFHACAVPCIAAKHSKIVIVIPGTVVALVTAVVVDAIKIIWLVSVILVVVAAATTTANDSNTSDRNHTSFSSGRQDTQAFHQPVNIL